jgi:chemotaxis signal transduction protein
VSLYLQIAVGAGLYLLDATNVLEIRLDIGGGDDARRWQGEAVATADLRTLFEETASPQAERILIAQRTGTPAALIVDRVEGLAEFGAAEFHSLPPIGPLGGMIDAVAMRPADQRLLLRVRGERVLATVAAVG